MFAPPVFFAAASILAVALYFSLAMWASKDMLPGTSLWNVRAVALELIGKLARIVFCWPAMPVHVDCFEIFDLQRDSATHVEVEASTALWVACMRENPWAYPTSQKQRLRQHATAALAHAMARELAEHELPMHAAVDQPVVRSWLREVDPNER